MYSRILIANRGEIAVRIIRACRELGIETIAVYSEIDRNALHVRLADRAYPIGPAPASQSYLSIANILQAARESAAQAIHPGYGFLSENAEFARAVREAGLDFIGPPAEAIQAMGDKAQARERMHQVGVPVVPGYQGKDNGKGFARIAARIGYPLLVKAAAGGGGKGMRVAWKAADLQEAMAAARREALHAFGDGRLIYERYVPRAHHVEIQVLADHFGNIVHLFERECSVQRRHQKIIEESPSPLLDESLRNRMGAAAVAAAESVGYTNAGTVEFILDPIKKEFYFLEMNTRLQVEHPVTELVTGLDIVQWQIRLAAGESLPFTQDQVHARGHALECRIYAEDPANNFLPATGQLMRFIQPIGPGVRVDTGFTTGDQITIHYDPLIAKIITFAESRDSAIRKMRSALCETVLLGLTTNWQFLQDILAHSDFQAGRVHTTWIDDQLKDWRPPDCPLPAEVLIAAALTQFGSAGVSDQSTSAQDRETDPYSPWRAANSFRIGEEM
jgi:3-methylcrotonyl-CoA carboxylase alpha subunit